MCEERAGTCAGGGQSSHEGERGLGQGQAAREMLLGIDRGREPEAQLSYYLFRVENQASEGDQGP